MEKNINKAKSTLFILILTVIGGLFQIWLLSFFLFVQEKPISTGILFGDGGLYFFSTSLVLSNLCLLWQNDTLKFAECASMVTIFCLLVILTLVTVAYISVLYKTQYGAVPLPFSQGIHVFSQIICFTLSLGYYCYAANLTYLSEDSLSD